MGELEVEQGQGLPAIYQYFYMEAYNLLYNWGGLDILPIQCNVH